MKKICNCIKQSSYDKLRRFILSKFLSFFGKMENKLWRKLYSTKKTNKCNCKTIDKGMEEFTKRVSSQYPNGDMFK